MVQNYEKWKFYEMAMQLVTEIYLLTNDFPDNEKFGLVSQIRRAAVSIPSNIAEGAGRGTKNELTQFFRIATGSITELLTQLQISANLNFITQDIVNELKARLISISKMMQAFQNNQVC